MMTFTQFRKIPADTVVRVVISEYEKAYHGRHGKLKFIVKKGSGVDDWAIYYGSAEWSDDMVRTQGDKLNGEDAIQDIFPCDKATMERYRK